MTAIESVTVPLALLFDDGSKKLAAACFKHQQGLLYLDTWWHTKKPDQAAHLIKGSLKGDGPWRIANVSIRVVGCQNTDPELQTELLNWQEYLKEAPDYPPRAQIMTIAKRLGAIISA